MRRSVVFAALTVPAVVWTGFTIWAQAQASGWTPAAGELSLPVRAALASSQWVIRVLPFVIIPVALAWPLIVVGIAAATERGSSGNSASRTAVVTWWCVSAVAFAATLVTAGIFFARRPEAELPGTLPACFGWMGIVAFWMSSAAAYAVQQKRYAAQQTGWKPRSVLAAVAALNCVGLYALPILAAIAFRMDDSRGKAGEAVEQGDEADKA